MIPLFSTLLIVAMLSECKGSDLSCEEKCIDNCSPDLTGLSRREKYLLNPEAYNRGLLNPEAEKKCLLDPFAKILSCQDCSLSDVTRDLQKWNQHLLSEDERKTLIAIFVPSQPGKSESLRRTCDGMVDILKQQYNYAVELKTEDFLKVSVEILTDIGDVYVKKADASSSGDKRAAYGKAMKWYHKAKYEAEKLKLPLTNPIRVRFVMGWMTVEYKMGRKTLACNYAGHKLDYLKYRKKNAETEAYKAKLDAWLVEYKC